MKIFINNNYQELKTSKLSKGKYQFKHKGIDCLVWLSESRYKGYGSQYLSTWVGEFKIDNKNYEFYDDSKKWIIEKVVEYINNNK